MAIQAFAIAKMVGAIKKMRDLQQNISKGIGVARSALESARGSMMPDAVQKGYDKVQKARGQDTIRQPLAPPGGITSLSRSPYLQRGILGTAAGLVAGPLVGPRENPQYDPNDPNEQDLPYKKAGFLRRLIGDPANELNQAYAGTQQEQAYKEQSAAAEAQRALQLQELANAQATELARGRETGETNRALAQMRYGGQLADINAQNDLARARYGAETTTYNQRAAQIAAERLAMKERLAPIFAQYGEPYSEDPIIQQQVLARYAADQAAQRAGQQKYLDAQAARASGIELAPGSVYLPTATSPTGFQNPPIITSKGGFEYDAQGQPIGMKPDVTSQGAPKVFPTGFPLPEEDIVRKPSAQTSLTPPMTTAGNVVDMTVPVPSAVFPEPVVPPLTGRDLNRSTTSTWETPDETASRTVSIGGFNPSWLNRARKFPGYLAERVLPWQNR